MDSGTVVGAVTVDWAAFEARQRDLIGITELQMKHAKAAAEDRHRAFHEANFARIILDDMRRACGSDGDTGTFCLDPGGVRCAPSELISEADRGKCLYRLVSIASLQTRECPHCHGRHLLFAEHERVTGYGWHRRDLIICTSHPSGQVFVVGEASRDQRLV
jgi:hypothetical protein